MRYLVLLLLASCAVPTQEPEPAYRPPTPQQVFDSFPDQAFYPICADGEIAGAIFFQKEAGAVKLRFPKDVCKSFI